MTFKERYHHLLVFKHPDVEEIIDMLFHRPAAAVFAALIYSLPISPNHVTYMSLATGWTGSLILFDAAISHHYFGHWGYVVAAFLFLFSVILDCADGQIARAKGGGTRMGRIVDGIVDALVVVSIYLVMVIDIEQRFGFNWALIGGLAGLNAWLQIGVYDKIKSVYLSRTAPSSADGSESMEEVEAAWEETKKTGGFGEKIGMFIYLKILLRLQNIVAPGSAAIDPEKLQSEEIERFRRKFSDPMRITSFLGLGTHMLLIYSAILLTAFWPPILLGLQFIFLSTFNFVLVYALWTNRKMSRF